MAKINFVSITSTRVTLERVDSTIGKVAVKVLDEEGNFHKVLYLTQEEFDSLVDVIQSLENDRPEFPESQLPPPDPRDLSVKPRDK